MILIENLLKSFPVKHGEKVAVDDLTLEVREGEFFTLLGPSGCGKTTTLRCVAGLENPTAGRITIGQRVVYDNRVLEPTHERRLGMVFQSYAVWPHMSVADNVAFPLTVGDEKVSRKQTRDRVEEALALVGLEGLGSRMATQLSGGQQQRLSVARALVRQPRVLLLDEPLSNLDAKLRDRMRSELRAIQQRVGITTLFVTHDQVEALSMSDRVAVMRDGRIQQLGTPPEIYHEPQSAFVAAFIGGANLYEGTVTSLDGDYATAATAIGDVTGRAGPGVRVGDHVVSAIRLEDTALVDDASGPTQANEFVGSVFMRLFNGSSIDGHLNLAGGQRLLVRLPSRAEITVGEEVRIRLPREHVRILPSEGASVDADDEAAPVSPPAAEGATR